MNTKSAPRELEDIQRMDMAAEWVLLLRQEPVKDEDIVGWLQWREADPRNQFAFERAQKLLGLMHSLSPEEILGDEPGESPRADADSHAPRRRSARATEHRTRRWRNGMIGSAFAATALLALAWHFALPPRQNAVGEQAIVTAAQPLQTTQLPDGSSMELGAKTVVAVNYTERQRTLELNGGEAYFSVAPNKARPFVVAAGPVRVRAVGTAFNVRRAGDRVVVTVTHGKVDVYEAGAADEHEPEHPVRVAAGGQIAWNGERKKPVIETVDPGVALAWREGRLEYAAEPLDAVIADLNRYSRISVVIEDESVKRLRFTGTVLTNATEEWLRALPGNFPVQLREKDGKLILAATETAHHG
ncbi:MAG: FecR domain-containing protein [Rudaea sp.]|uniref:FecR family protein n=1 Tax=unclassified Rudaea TaxID=2627037 RepID=UPI0010F7496C|nr:MULTISPECIES: FecR domain-containing protein [unclassified Rudaea]MBN8888403.1 FecR domain-containing protein [Rudaea sp.]MBR0345723.1 FecR domain-containing protein [Rudaea sp.]